MFDLERSAAVVDALDALEAARVPPPSRPRIRCSSNDPDPRSLAFHARITTCVST
jgi:hypothetical protein